MLATVVSHQWNKQVQQAGKRELLVVACWVQYCTVRMRYCACAQFCGHQLVGAHDVFDAMAGGQQIVGDDAPVTSPPDCFRAHDCGAILSCGLGQVSKRVVKCCCQCVVGVVVEATILPPGVCFKCHVLANFSSSSEALAA